jgi:hypothetical protein
VFELILNKGIKKTRILAYNDIDQMPTEVFQLVNKYWMLGDELGTSIEDIENKHLKKIVFVAKDPKKVVEAVSKMSSAIRLITGEINVENMAFAASVYSVDGIEVKDRSEESLKRLLKELSGKGLTMDLVKKKTSGKRFLEIWRSIFQPSLRIQEV